MPPVLGPLSPSKTRLWSCARGQRNGVLAIAEHEEGDFLARQEFLHHHFGAGLAHAAAEDHLERGLGLFQRHGDDHALAGGEPIGLDHDRRALRAHIIFCGGDIGEALIGRGRDIIGRGRCPW